MQPPLWAVILRTAVVGAAALVFLAGSATKAEDKLLAEAVEFTGQVLFIESRVPALIIGAVRNGEKVVFGFGETARGSGKVPDGDTVLRVGSLTKAFTGQVLASLVADGTVGFTDRLQERLGWDLTLPQMDGREIRLIDLATHTSGLPREVERQPGPPDDPFATLTAAAYAKELKSNPLLFAPGTGALYSNFGFDALAAALANAAGQPYQELLRRRVLDPVGLNDTVLTRRAADADRLLQGHSFDGSPLPDVKTTEVSAGSGGLYSTPNDILRWLAWHMDRVSKEHREIRLLDHAAYVQRDGLSPVYGLDESGHMDALGLGWIVMMPEGDRPFILQKAGGFQGVFTYTAFAPTRGVGAFVAISQFDFGVAMKMATVVNELIAQLAPR